MIKSYFKFIQHYRGPFSREVQEIIKDPIFLENHWNYIPPERKDVLNKGIIINETQAGIVKKKKK